MRIREERAGGYPADYLLARIVGRAARLVSDWRAHLDRRVTPPASDEEIWGALLRELEWLHAQMNGELRETFAPLFALLEIKTIVLCLRNRALHRTDAIDRLLERSLLAEDLKLVLRRAPDVQSAIRGLGFAPSEDLQSFENALMRTFLTDVARDDLDPAIRTFFRDLIDLRNVMLLYKHLRWRLAARPLFIPGGTIDVTQLESVRDDDALDDLLRRVAGARDVSVASSEGALETILLRAMTRRLVKSRRSAGNTALVVAYVWRLYTQARNLAVLHHGTGLEQRTLERELIL